MAAPGRLPFTLPISPRDKSDSLAVALAPWVAAATAFIAALVILSGWTYSPPNSIFDTTQSMLPQTGVAVGLALAAVSIAVITSGSRSKLAHTLIGLAGLSTLFIGIINFIRDVMPHSELIAFPAALWPLNTAPNASIAFILLGGSFFFTRSFSLTPSQQYARGLAGAITATIGIVAAASHALDMPTGYLWSRDAPLSIVGSIGLTAAGLGAMANVLSASGIPGRRSFTLIAMTVLVGGMAASGLAGTALYSTQIESEKQFVGLVANNVTRYLNRALSTDLLQLETMAAQWRATGRIPEAQWRAQADLMLDKTPGLRAVMWVDAEIVGQRVAPADLPGVWTGRKYDAPLLLEYGRRIMEGTEPSLYPVFDGQRGRSFSTLMPVYNRDKQDGLLVTVVDTNEWGESVMGDVSRQAHVRITDSIGVVYDNGVIGLKNGLQAGIVVEVGEEQWLVTATETQQMVDAISSSLPQTVTALGVTLTLLLYVSTLIAQTSLRRAKALADSNNRLESEVSARQAVQNRLEREIRIRLDTEADLKTDRERLDLALGAGGTGTWYLDPETGELEWDQRMASLFGFDEDTFDGTYETFKAVVLEEDIQRIERAIARSWETGDEFEEDFRIQRSDGGLHVIYGKARVVTAPSGKNKIMIGINQDVTERRRSEKLSTLGALAAGFAHELNNPLMGCVNYVAYAMRKTENTRAREALGKAETEIKRVIRVVQDMLSFSRFKEDFGASANISSTVDRAADLIATSYQTGGITFENTIDAEIDAAGISEDALEQVVLNLLVNAGHALEDTPTKIVTVKAEQDERRVYISITDTGSGIPEEIQPRLFEPFFTTKKAGKGSGLGLSISLDIIKRFGGHLSFDTKPGTGTTFTLTLPKIGSLNAPDTN